MPKFHVPVKEINYGYVVVEADTIEEAADKGLMLAATEMVYSSAIDYELTKSPVRIE